MIRRYAVPGGAALLLTLITVLYLLGALRASPGVAFARNDLDIVRALQQTGRLADHPTEPAHLTKPGYILYLAVALPHAGSEPAELRRFLLLNALWMLSGILLVSDALWRRSHVLALLFLFAVALFPPLRDTADYVASESIAAGTALLFAGCLLRWGTHPVAQVALGITSGLVLLLRPNLGWVLLGVATLAVSAEPRHRTRGVARLLGGFGASVLLLVGLARLTALPADPFRVDTSRAFLWGTADYYWQPDVGGWPVGNTAQESRNLRMAKTRERWRGLLRQAPADSRRALLWRLTHSLLSKEELPSRWQVPMYFVFDKWFRRWWWVLATLIVACAAVAALGGRGPWRFVPISIVIASVAQGVAFGADPRFSLIFLPLVLLGLLIALPGVRPRPLPWIGGGLIVPILFVIARVVPDATASDYAVVRGAGHIVAQHIPADEFPSGTFATLHLRVLKFPLFPLGLEVRGNDEVLLRREPADRSPYPAYLTLPLTGRSLAEARRSGLALEVRTVGAASVTDAFIYYPAVPPLLSGNSTVDGRRVLESGYGGTTGGGIPIWVHAGEDPAKR